MPRGKTIQHSYDLDHHGDEILLEDRKEGTGYVCYIRKVTGIDEYRSMKITAPSLNSMMDIVATVLAVDKRGHRHARK